MRLSSKPASSREYRRPESVLVVIYNLDEEVLLLERCQPAGYWQSVTGSLEWAESAEACAKRELLEETGIVATPLNTGMVNHFKIMPEFKREGRDAYAPGVNENIEYVFSVQLNQAISPVLSISEHTRYAWLDAETAKAWCFSSTNAQAIARIVAGK